MFFVLRVTQLLRGLAQGMGVQGFSTAQQASHAAGVGAGSVGLNISGAFQLQAGGLLPLARCTRLVHLACNDSTVTDEELGPIW